MTIYLVKECSGQYEDYSEYIRYCTSNKAKAKNKKTELEQQHKLQVEQSKKCWGCEADCFNKKDYDKIKEMVKSHCNIFKIEIYDDGSYGCENCYHLWNESTFEIVEMECEE